MTTFLLFTIKKNAILLRNKLKRLSRSELEKYTDINALFGPLVVECMGSTYLLTSGFF